jgi:hypothetical protein
MIKTLAIIILLFSLPPNAALELKEVRELFYKATESRKVAEEFREKMTVANEQLPVFLGYKAMAEMLMANYSFNPINKISYFNKGKDLLEKSVKLAPKSAELRFLRFSIQTNAPSFLLYKSSIEEDKKVILQYLQTATSDVDLDKRMREYLLESTYCSEQEKKSIK